MHSEFHFRTLKRGRSRRGFTKREARIFRAQFRRLREAAAEEGYSPVQKFTAAQQRADRRYLRDSAILAIQAFSESYFQRANPDADALDPRASFHESYERHSGKTRAHERHLLNVVHTKGCERKFQVAIPGTHKVVTAEPGMKSMQIKPVACPHCGGNVRLKLPEGLAVVRADEQGDPSTRQDGRGEPLGMDSGREPDRGDVFPDDDQDNLDDLRDEDADREEDEEEDEDEADRPRSGPFRPGSGVRDSARAFYRDSERGSKSSRRAEAALATFKNVLREHGRYSGEVY